MFNYKIFIILLILLPGSFSAFAQNDVDFQLANQLMQQHRYEEALPVLIELTQNNPENFFYSNWLIDCHIQLKQYDDALKVADRFKNDPQYSNQTNIRIAELFHFKGEKEKAFELWRENLEKNANQLQTYINTANVLMEHREYLQAVEVYKSGRIQFNNTQLFFGDIATAYMRAGEYEQAINEWLALVEHSPEQLSYVQRSLLRFNDPILYDITIMELDDRLDKLHASSPVFQPFYQLQIWLLQENKLYRRALASAKAFENSSSSYNYSLFHLGRQLVASNEFELAAEAFSYYIETGNGETKWRNQEELSSTYSKWAKYIDDHNLDFHNEKDSLYALAVSNLDDIIDQTKHYSRLNLVYLQKAELALDYVFDLDQAKNALAHLSNIPNNQESPEVFYLQGRIHLAKQEYALARVSLTKANKLANIGELAEKTRYFLALTDFFSGDYEFAAIQLKSLGRQNTSYYANDALELRLWLQQGLSSDTTGAELGLFASAVFKQMNGEPEESAELFLEMLHGQINVALKDDIMLFILDSPHLPNEDKMMELSTFITSNPVSAKKEELLWEKAKLSEKMMRNCKNLNSCSPDQSLDFKSQNEIYEELILSYPNGFYAPYARERLTNLSQQNS